MILGEDQNKKKKGIALKVTMQMKESLRMNAWCSLLENANLSSTKSHLEVWTPDFATNLNIHPYTKFK